MPVTARLSKNFYDKLGEDVANELVDWFNQVDATYRTDLRELNELNFARFDAKLEQRLEEYDARMAKRFAESEVNMERRFAEYDAKIDTRFAEYDAKMDTRFAEYDTKMDTRFAQMEDSIDRRFAEVGSRFDTLESDFARLGTALEAKLEEKLEAKLEIRISKLRTDLIRWMFVFWTGTMIPVAGILVAVLT
jgi:DNA anti-recombination protein RmuC